MLLFGTNLCKKVNAEESYEKSTKRFQEIPGQFISNYGIMKINILPFGSLTDALPAAGFDFSTDTISSIADLHAYLSEKYPATARQNFRYAVNQELVDEQHLLQDGDEVALLPPFSGG
jgi:sulfur-carrier protein